MADVPIVLASRSPRRRELLTQMGVGPFTILVPEGPETAPPGLTPDELVVHLAVEKAAAREATSGSSATKREKYGMTAATRVCWSMSSDTQT